MMTKHSLPHDSFMLCYTHNEKGTILCWMIIISFVRTATFILLVRKLLQHTVNLLVQTSLLASELRVFTRKIFRSHTANS